MHPKNTHETHCIGSCNFAFEPMHAYPPTHPNAKLSDRAMGKPQLSAFLMDGGKANTKRENASQTV